MRKSAALAGAVSGTVLLAFTGALAARTTQPHKDSYGLFEKKLSRDQQILHALNRLTFGPRPGDVEVVKRMGLKKWIDLQLHPEQIPENQQLEALLEPLETLRLTPAEAVAEYPTPQLIRAVALGRQKPPEDPIAREAVERLARRFDVRKDLPDDQPLEPRIPLGKLLSVAQLRTLRSGSLEQKRETLDRIPRDRIDDVVIAMQPQMRNQLLPAASPELRRKLMLANNPQQVVLADLSEAKLDRAVYGSRQLEEVLVDFWYNHFNVFLDKGADRILAPSYERDAIRPYVLGKFRDLLEATATSPAMLFYLDNWQSVAPLPDAGKGKRAVRGLNENYGRELMELHTLGVGGGYTQKDVIEVARCFTGWTIQAPNRGGGFIYNDRVHDKGEKVVLGVTIPAGGGREDGEKVLDILASHPSTAHFISKELAERFVADDPPPALVDAMAKTFLDTGGDLRAVMTTMISSKEFFSQGAYRAKVKTPFELVVSALRATGARLDYAMPAANQIAAMGEPLYRKLEPTGYSNINADWVSSASLLARMNFGLQLGENYLQGAEVNTAKYNLKPNKPKQEAELIARRLLFTNASAQTLQAIDKSLAEQEKKNPRARTNPALIAGLVIGSPDFQRR